MQVQLDGTPRVRIDQLTEVTRQLWLGQSGDLTIEVLADAPDGPGIGFDGLGLQASELEVLEMALILQVKVRGRGCDHADESSRN